MEHRKRETSTDSQYRSPEDLYRIYLRGQEEVVKVLTPYERQLLYSYIRETGKIKRLDLKRQRNREFDDFYGSRNHRMV